MDNMYRVGINKHLFSQEAEQAGKKFMKKLISGELKMELEPYGILTESEILMGRDIRRQAYYDNLYKKDVKDFKNFLCSSTADIIFDYIDELDKQDKTLVLRK